MEGTKRQRNKGDKEERR